MTASLAFPGGVIGHVDCSFEAPFRCEYELVGTSGSVRVPDAYLPPERPSAIRLGAGGDVVGVAPEPLSFEGTNQYACMVDAFARAVASGSLESPAEDGVAQMRTLDAIQEAAFDV